MADDPKADALNAAADFIKVSTSLAVGALVFGIGYFSNVSTLTLGVRLALIIATVAFLLSAVLGVLAHSRVPVMMSATNYNLRDRTLSRLGIGHQLTLAVGGITFAVALCLTITNQPPAASLPLPSADVAVQKARQSLPKGVRIKSVQTIELLRGVDSSSITKAVWHIRFVLTGPKQSMSTEDVFVEAATGVVSHDP